MIRRFFRWLLKLVILAAIVIVAVALKQFFAHRYRPGSVVVLTLDGTMAERGNYSVLGNLNEQSSNSLNVVRRSLKGAENDPRIVGLAIKLIDPDMELAQAQEITAMIKEFRKHGKWTTAYMETAGESGYGNLPYLVASSANEVSMMPQGEVDLLGVSIRELFARDTFDWLKIKPVFDAIGQYKDAANIFTQKNFTAAQYEEDDALAGGMFDQITGQIADQRHTSAASVRAIVDRAPLSASAALQSHLLDRLEYEDQFEDRVRNYGGQHHDLIDYDNYGPPSAWFASQPKIAVIYGVGAIDRGSSGYDPILSPGSNSMGSDDITKAFDDARDDSSVRAVLFRIDSPGGSVIASELIRREVELCAAKKPVVVSMSEYAASGGYWVATPAAKMFADPGTITGSIGVLGGKFDVSAAAQAIGVNSGSAVRGANAEMFDSFTGFTPAQAKIFRDQMLGDTYQYFLKIVAASRHMTTGQVDTVAQGRVWTGEQAIQNKLVDQLGGFDTALAEAKVLAKIDPNQEVQLEELPNQPSMLEKLLTGRIYGDSPVSPAVQRTFEPLLRIAREAMAMQRLIGQAYCPLVPVL